jgi:anti-anti-sigma regulatory factor
MAVPMSTIAVFLKVEEANAVSALQEAAGSLDGAHGEAVLDCSSLRRIDSAAMRALEAFARAAEEKGVKVVLSGVNVGIYKVLKLVKLTRRFSFVN